MTSALKIGRYARDLGINVRETLENWNDGNSDFEVDNYRFIDRDSIDEIQCEELAGDEYVLGCFNASFLADILDAPQEAIEAMQQAEAFEAVGKWVIESGNLEALQEAYSGIDGYGHHFSHYDFSEDEIGDYYVFRIN